MAMGGEAETDILQELREPLPKVEGYNGEYVDEDAVLSIFKDAADEIERLRNALREIAEYKHPDRHGYELQDIAIAALKESGDGS